MKFKLMLMNEFFVCVCGLGMVRFLKYPGLPSIRISLNFMCLFWCQHGVCNPGGKLLFHGMKESMRVGVLHAYVVFFSSPPYQKEESQTKCKGYISHPPTLSVHVMLPRNEAMYFSQSVSFLFDLTAYDSSLSAFVAVSYILH